jgi:hypothetical protein
LFIFLLEKVDSSVEDIVANAVVSSGIALKERLDAMVQLNVLKKAQKASNKKHVCALLLARGFSGRTSVCRRGKGGNWSAPGWDHILSPNWRKKVRTCGMTGEGNIPKLIQTIHRSHPSNPSQDTTNSNSKTSH